MTRTGRLAALAACGVLLGGCVTRQEYLQRDAEIRKLLLDAQSRVARVQRELDRLRGDLETGGRRPGTGGGDDRVGALEERLRALEAGGARPGGAEPNVIDMNPGSSAPLPEAPPATLPPSNTATVPPVETSRPAAPVTPPPASDDWGREVLQAQATIGAMNVAEKAEFVPILDTVARKDCAKGIEQLNSFASKRKDSPLADDALYWAARCYLRRGDQTQALQKYYDVAAKYPKGDRAAAALLEQADLFIKMGNTPDARIVLSRLTNYYPNSDEASQARQRLAEIGR